MGDDEFRKKTVAPGIGDPLGKFARRAVDMLERGSAKRMLGAFDSSYAQQAIRDMQDTVGHRLIQEQIERSQRYAGDAINALKVLDALAAVPKAEIQALRAQAIADSLNSYRINGFASSVSAMLEQQRQLGLSVRSALEPYPGSTTKLSEAVIECLAPYRKTSLELSSWKREFEMRVGKLDTAWLSADVSASVLGFAHMTRLHDAVQFDHPFAKPVVELFDDEFGEFITDEVAAEDREEAALARGFNPGLLAFPAEHFPGVIVTAGFSMRLERLPVPMAIENADPTAEFNAAHRDFIEQVEHRMRLLLQAELAKLNGGEKAHVPGDVMRRWKERQQRARDEGRPVYALIFYADFMDMAEVIRRKPVWEVVEHLFRSKDDTLVTLQRLHPIRNDPGHTRPIGRSDQLTLVAEATRLLKALGCEVLH